MERFTLGRSSKSDMTINHAAVSSRHASMFQHRGVVLIEDLSSTNGTFLNFPVEQNELRPGRPAELRQDDIVYFSKDCSLPAQQLLRRFQIWLEGGMQKLPAAPGETVKTFDQPQIRIGSDPQNDIVLPFLSVRPFHAEIQLRPDGIRVFTDFGGSSYINGVLIRGQTAQLPVDITIEIGGVDVSIGASGTSPQGLRIGVLRAGIYLQAKNVAYEIGEGHLILDRLETAVFPGEFIGLLGPSGCGKTTFLNVLNGTEIGRRGVSGEVSYNGVSLAQNKARFANQIGYVPQDDIMHAELTVREVLYYSARLRLPPATADRAIHEKIDQLCHGLGLWKPEEGEDKRETKIGSPEEKTLSGGQKKRVNLAIELLTDPRILFLDEPTSGLSSRDTWLVMDFLRELSVEKNISIIITIHQPSPRVYRLLDNTIYLKAGKLCYFGPAWPDSIQYFEKVDPPEVAGPDKVMENVDTRPENEMQLQFLESADYNHHLRKRHEVIEAKTAKGSQRSRSDSPPAILQFWSLLKRYTKCKIRDVGSLLILLVQAPIVAFFLSLAFEGRGYNHPLFLSVFVAIWFGTNNTARELVGEISIYRRERRSGLHPGAYFASKVVLQAIVVLFQVTILLWMSDLFLDFEMSLFLGVIICWFAAMVGISIGLLISAVSKTEVAAIVATPLVLIPFILLGGHLRPYDETKGLGRALVEIVPTRWAYEAIVHAEHLKTSEEDLPALPTEEQEDEPVAKMLLAAENEENGKKKLNPFSLENEREISSSERRGKIALCLFILTLLTAVPGAIAFIKLREPDRSLPAIVKGWFGA